MKRQESSKVLKMPKRIPTPPFAVESRILFLRHQRVILDADIAALYGVPVKVLNQQIKRNRERFPPDFLFQLTAREYEVLRSQIVTSKERRGGRRYLPYAFTEHGAIMAAAVLNSALAVEMSIFVVRAFIRLRHMLATNRKLALKIFELEERLGTHDSAIRELVKVIKELMSAKRSPRRCIGFQLPAARAGG
jgi:hypothetical protein